MTEARQEPFWDPDLSIEQRLDDLLLRLTLEEKISQMLDKAPAIERLGIPEYNWWNEALHGVARAGRATVFPQAIGMAASFDEPLLHRIATAISDEVRAKHHEALSRGNHSRYFGLTVWSPNINIFRDPRWGRGQETYGEDPYLTSRLGVSFCRGLQGEDPAYLKTVATPKHYAVHSGPEADRHHFDAVVSPRDLWETYLPAFEACIREAGAYSIMGAYNRTNAEPCCGSPTLLGKILREQWGFKGFVVSDCAAIIDFHEHHKITKTPAESSAMAVKNGCDLNCGNCYHHLNAAVQAGLIDEAEIDIAVRRLFRARLKLGMFDPPARVPYSMISPDVVECDAHVELTCEMARESIVLLKNQENLLPLDWSRIRSIGLVGPSAHDMRVLVGNYNGFASRMVTPLEALIAAAPAGVQVAYVPGCGFGNQSLDRGWLQWEFTQSDVDVILAVMGFTPEMEGEEGATNPDIASEGGGDRTVIGLPGRQQELLEFLHGLGKPIVLVLTGGSPISVPWAQENIPAILHMWYPGQQGGTALMDILFGKAVPSGRLPVTVPKDLTQLPAFEDYAMAGRTYRYMEAEPLYRFGYGLSYTTFVYDHLDLGESVIGPEDEIQVSVEISNTGEHDADEVVQLYVENVGRSVPAPRVHLQGFQRVYIPAGGTAGADFILRASQLAVFDEEGKPFVEPGTYRISVGGAQPSDPIFTGQSAELTVRT